METPPLLSNRVLCLLLEAWVLLGETMVEKATVARVPLLRNVVKGMTAIRVVLSGLVANLAHILVRKS